MTYTKTEVKWKDIQEFEGRYKVSNSGLVFSVVSGIMLKPFLRKDYEAVQISYHGKKVKHNVHRLVAEYFIDNPKDLPIVNHIDGNKRNNLHLNLEWCTISENTQHAYDNGLIELPKGSSRYNSKLVESDVIWIRDNFVSGCKIFGASALGKKFGVDRTTIRDIILIKNWKHI